MLKPFFALVSTCFCAFGFTTELKAADTVKGEQVAVRAEYDQTQPEGWPVVVHLIMTNTGNVPIYWWCGGPARFPGANCFAAQIWTLNDQTAHDEKERWLPVEPTNGQYTQGSGSSIELKPGQWVDVPVAIPVPRTGDVSFLVWPNLWHTSAATSGRVTLSDDRAKLEARQADVIRAVVSKPADSTDLTAFNRHLAEQYSDATVLDAILKFAELDNAELVSRAANVLRGSRRLPKEAGPRLAAIASRWLVRPPDSDGRDEVPRWAIAGAALKTQSEPARIAVLNAMAQTRVPADRWTIMEEVRNSPGDYAWFVRARGAIVALPLNDAPPAEDAKNKQRALDWLDNEIRNAAAGIPNN